MAKAKGKTGEEAPQPAHQKQDMRALVEDVVGDDLDWPDESALPAAHEPEPKPAKAPAKKAPPPAQDEDAGEEDDEELLEAEDDEEEGEPENEADRTINDLKKTVADKQKKIDQGASTLIKERRIAARNQVESNLANWDTAFDKEIGEATSTLKQLKADLAAAFDAGDGMTAADKQELISAEVMRLANANAGKNQVKQNKEFLKNNPNWAPDVAGAPAEKAAAGSGDEVEYTPEAKQWIDGNPHFNTDKKYKAACVSAHVEFQELQKAGEISDDEDSPAYFKFIENHPSVRKRARELDKDTGGRKAPAQVEEDEEPATPPPRKRQSPQNIAAPGGSRGGSNPPPAGAKLKAKLTADEVWAANQSGYNTPAELAEYAEILQTTRNKKR